MGTITSICSSVGTGAPLGVGGDQGKDGDGDEAMVPKFILNRSFIGSVYRDQINAGKDDSRIYFHNFRAS